MAVSSITPQAGAALSTANAASTNATTTDKEAKKAERAVAKGAINAYGKAAKPPEPTTRDAANVQISQKAREMNLARKVIDETPDVREDKVAHFKELIAKGEYKPDPGKIADGMVREAIRDELAKNPAALLE